MGPKQDPNLGSTCRVSWLHLGHLSQTEATQDEPQKTWTAGLCGLLAAAGCTASLMAPFASYSSPWKTFHISGAVTGVSTLALASLFRMSGLALSKAACRDAGSVVNYLASQALILNHSGSCSVLTSLAVCTAM